MFARPMWLIGAGMSLESMRRGFIGGTCLSLFIDLSGLDQESCMRDLGTLRGYLPIEEHLIQSLPPFLQWLASPFIDYHKANVCFLAIAEALCRAKGELYCQTIWETYEEQEAPT